MCLLCVEIQKSNMTTREVASAYRELKIPDGHWTELMTVIAKSYNVDDVASELNNIFFEELKLRKKI